MKMQRPAWRLALGLAGGLLAAGLAAAVAPEVNDQGKFFSAAAIKKANDKILDIARKYDRDVLIETFEAPPGTPAEKVKAMSAKERNDFFRDLAKKRCQERAVYGLYVLITKEPTYLYLEEVTLPGKTRPGPRLSDAAQTKLREYLIGQFRKRQFDDGLTGLVQHVEDALAAGAKK